MSELPPYPGSDLADEKAQRVEAVLQSYAEAMGTADDGVDTVVSDLVADLVHHCRTRDVPVGEVFRRGVGHAFAEVMDPGEAMVVGDAPGSAGPAMDQALIGIEDNLDLLGETAERAYWDVHAADELCTRLEEGGAWSATRRALWNRALRTHPERLIRRLDDAEVLASVPPPLLQDALGVVPESVRPALFAAAGRTGGPSR